MMSEAGYSVAGAYDLAQAVPFRAGRIQWIRKPGEGGREHLAAGFWHVTPEDLPAGTTVTLPTDETVHILSGRVRIETAGGETHDLATGAVASFNAGARTVWTVLEPTVEFFVYS